MAKYRAKGTILTLDGVVIEQWRDGSHSGGDAERIDVTTHDTAGNSREFLAGFQGENTYDFELVWDENLPGAMKLEELAASGEEVPGILTYPDIGASHTFDAIVMRYGMPNTGLDGALVRAVTLSVSNIELVATASL